MNFKGKSLVFTGKECVFWAGSEKGINCLAAGNMLKNNKVLKEMIKAFEKEKKSLPEKLIKALKAGQKAGGDKRNKKFNSAVIIIEKLKGGIEGKDNQAVDLRVDYSKNSIKELSKLLKVSKREWN